MRACEFKSVLDARRQAEENLAFFRKMMLEKEMRNKDGHTENNPIRGCDFKSVIEVRQQVKSDLEWFREMLDAKEARRSGKPVNIPTSCDMPLLNRIWPCWQNIPDHYLR